MGKKAGEIAALKRQVTFVTGLYEAERQKVKQRDERIARLEAQRKPSLRDTAKREWQQFTDRVMQGLGL